MNSSPQVSYIRKYKENKPGVYKVDTAIVESIKIVRQIPHQEVAILWDEGGG